jgi:hypothetical protein
MIHSIASSFLLHRSVVVDADAIIAAAIYSTVHLSDTSHRF